MFRHSIFKVPRGGNKKRRTLLIHQDAALESSELYNPHPKNVFIWRHFRHLGAIHLSPIRP